MNRIIFKGCHYSFPLFTNIIRTHGETDMVEISNDVTFDESCKYEIDEKSCVNKLFGFCYGLCGVHKNSTRFGWTHNKDTDTIDIYAYVYTAGKLVKSCIGYVRVGETHNFKLREIINGNHRTIEMYIDGVPVKVFSIEEDELSSWLFTLHPYFGGNTTAPHTMYINIKKV